MFTRSSVHCADRIVATKHSSGFVKFSATCASGCAFDSRLMISGARSSMGLFRVSDPAFGDMAHTLARQVVRERVAGRVVRPSAVVIHVHACGADHGPVGAVPHRGGALVDREQGVAARVMEG